MKPYSGRDGGHNAGYHSANALLGMIHGITRLIELVASRKFSGKRIPRSKPRFIALPPGDILWQFIWSIVLTISFLNYLVGPIEFGKRQYQHGLGRISYIKQFVLPWNSLCQGMCVVFDSVSEVTRTVLIEVDRAGNGGKPSQVPRPTSQSRSGNLTRVNLDRNTRTDWDLPPLSPIPAPRPMFPLKPISTCFSYLPSWTDTGKTLNLHWQCWCWQFWWN